MHKERKREGWLILTGAALAGGMNVKNAMDAADRVLEGYATRFKAEEDKEDAEHRKRYPDDHD